MSKETRYGRVVRNAMRRQRQENIRVEGVHVDPETREKLRKDDAQRRGHSLRIYSELGLPFIECLGDIPARTNIVTDSGFSESDIFYDRKNGDAWQIQNGQPRKIVENHGRDYRKFPR